MEIERHFNIMVPIWESRSVGLADHKLGDVNIVEIDYKDKHGEKTFPGQYFIRGYKAREYPIKDCGKVKLRIIPIADMELLS